MSGDRLSPDGKCTGRHNAPGCIKDRCKARVHRCYEHSVPEVFNRLKCRRFECAGPENCGKLEEYGKNLK